VPISSLGADRPTFSRIGQPSAIFMSVPDGLRLHDGHAGKFSLAMSSSLSAGAFAMLDYFASRDQATVPNSGGINAVSASLPRAFLASTLKNAREGIDNFRASPRVFSPKDRGTLALFVTPLPEHGGCSSLPIAARLPVTLGR